MFEELKFWWEERKIHKSYAAQTDEWPSDYLDEMFRLDQKRRHYRDSKFVKTARRHYVPIPPESDKDGLWEEQDEDEWFLTEKGISYLRKEIREEQKASREKILAWVPFLSAIAGILGSILGLIFLLSRR